MMTQDPYRRRPGHALANLVEAGRDFVHGAAGARPGSRRRRGSGGISQVSRWVGEGINWLLEDNPDGMAQEAPWTEPPSPPESLVNGERRGRPGKRIRDSSGMESPWSHQSNQGSQRRPLQVIPHPAPPLLLQAEPDLEQESRRRRDGSGSRPSSRPRPRSSRRIRP